MIVLIGFMGAGKSTVGRALAGLLHGEFADSDAHIEQRTGRAIGDVFASEGEAYFRALEHEAVAELVTGPAAVVALGGGAVEDARTRQLLAAATVVHLRVDFDEALRRIGADPARPMLRRGDLPEIFDRRLRTYQAAAALSLDTTGRAPDDLAVEILRLVGPSGG